MKNLSYVINGILAVAVIILFILHFTSNNDKPAQNSALLKFENDSTITLPIAYVDVDSLLANYDYANEISGILMNKSESAAATISQQEKRVLAEQQEFQRKAQNNAFLSQERAEQEYQRIQKLQVNLQQTAANLEQEFLVEQQKYNKQIEDSVRLCIAEFNKTANYEIILSNSRLDNILFAKDKYEITGEILNLLNKRYAASKK